MPSIRSIEVYRTAGQAIDNARRGGGPSFIEARTYRLRDHHGTGSGVEVGYRTQKEVDEWASQCPVKHFERFLLEQKSISMKEVDEHNSEIDREIEEAFEFAKNSALPSEDDVSEHLYS